MGSNTKFLENLERAQQLRNSLTNVSEFSEDVKQMIQEHGLTDWLSPLNLIKSMFVEIDNVNKVARNVQGEDIVKMASVFEEAAAVPELIGSRESLYKLYNELNKSNLEDIEEFKSYFEVAWKADLDFTKHRAHLKNSRVVVMSLKKYFDDIFGTSRREIEYINALSWIEIVLICIGTIIVMTIVALSIYGLTESGRTKYLMLWLYYFGKEEDYEERWRYSLFMDTVKDKNVVLDAVREVNTKNLLKALKNGAYINVYNKYGNTALHVATKLGYVEIVEMLIKHGADRFLLNAQNKTPEQQLLKIQDLGNELERVQSVYRKHRKRNYRMSVPQKFPVSSFHLWLENDTDIELSNRFMNRFPSMVSDQSENVTHLVVKTDENGVLITDKVDLISWIFNGIIVLREQYMTDCLVDESLLSQDKKYLVENVKYKGVIYNSVLQWTEAMAKGTMPYLFGAYVAIVMEKYDNAATITAIVDAHGGIMMDEFPQKKFFNKHSHPYLHSNLGPLFLIHDGTIDLKVYKDDPDRMYTLFTEQQFISFMLKRDIHRDTRENPIPVLKGKRK
uniref:BRCT domain-containing protein n=1 Tax=Caenorhabditis tropicalis TaxID=1561998 RepID=A0A1I7SXM7_9PELO